ncbi:hypothetical protein RFI_17591, partial [Reticulomyxa filosa]
MYQYAKCTKPYPNTDKGTNNKQLSGSKKNFNCPLQTVLLQLYSNKRIVFISLFLILVFLKTLLQKKNIFTFADRCLPQFFLLWENSLPLGTFLSRLHFFCPLSLYVILQTESGNMTSKAKSRQELDNRTNAKQQKMSASSAPTKSGLPSNKRTEKDNRKVTVVNEYMEYDNKLQLLYTRKAIAKGTRIFVECPFFMIGVPPVANHPGNMLYAYEKFKKDVSPEKQSMVFAAFHSSSPSSSSNSNDKKRAMKHLQKPEIKKQESIEANIAYLQTKWQASTNGDEEKEKENEKKKEKQINTNTNTNTNANTNTNTNKTKKPYHDKDWEDMSRLAYILHYYSINLQYVSPLDDEMNTVDKFQLQWFDSKTAQPLVAGDANDRK